MDKQKRLQRRALTAIVIAVLATAIGAVFGAAGSGQAASSATAPKNTTEPSISGTAQQGQTLSANHGDWSGTAPITYHYQWQRCDAKGGSCAGISGATARLYDVKSQDVGNTLRVHVTATNSAGSTTANSNATSVVAPATAKPAPNGCPAGTGTVNVSDLSPPARLAIDTWNANPSTLTRDVGTLTIKVHISACGGRAVQGALVYAAAVPFNQFTTSEVQSDGTGWATITEQQQSGYPANPGRQQLLAVYLRARKAGDPQGQGVFTARLVSFPVRLH